VAETVTRMTQENLEFLPGVYSLGDVLEKEGYIQEFMCGSNANFGSRAAYFTKHGN
jgi:phosphoglycerol transferase